MNKQLHIWINEDYPKETIHAYKSVKDALNNREKEVVHTTNTHFCSTKYYNEGYRLFAHLLNGETVEISLGSDNKYTDREIRMENNLEKLLLANEFGEATE